MATTLYDVLMPTYLQVLGGLRGVLEKGLAHAKETGLDPDSLVGERLIADMQPFSFQIEGAVGSSAGALRNLKQGKFTIPTPTTYDYAALQKLVADAETELRGWTPEAVNALENNQFVLDTGRAPAMTFTGPAFLFSFMLPNFFFHAVTAYDILRMKGVPVGKMDYLGPMRTS